MRQIFVFECLQSGNSSPDNGAKAAVVYALCKGFRSSMPCACFLVLALTFGLLVHPAVAAAEDNKSPAGSLEQIRKLAEEGNAEAQYKLGRMNEEGLVGATEDYREAAKWFLKAAEKGHAQAQYKMGIMYTLGKGVYKDRVEAAKWFGKAAQQGYEPVKQQIQETGAKLKDRMLKDPFGVLQRKIGG
jgi:TPR repeat protein